MKYRTIETLKENHDAVKERYSVKPSWAITDPETRAWITKHIPTDSQILDIGSASGAALAELKKYGYKNISGIDLDNYLTQVTKEDFASFAYVNLNTERIPHPDKTFDHVIAFAVLEHLENAFHFARESARILKSGGYIVVTLPNIYRINSAANLFFKRYIQGYNKYNDHIMLLTEEIFEKAFGGNFDLVKKFYSPGFIRIPFIRRKIKVGPSRLFSTKACYILRKKA